jgi:hypothetical protein
MANGRKVNRAISVTAVVLLHLLSILLLALLIMGGDSPDGEPLTFDIRSVPMCWLPELWLLVGLPLFLAGRKTWGFRLAITGCFIAVVLFWIVGVISDGEILTGVPFPHFGAPPTR